VGRGNGGGGVVLIGLIADGLIQMIMIMGGVVVVVLFFIPVGRGSILHTWGEGVVPVIRRWNGRGGM